jgi:hypothetical protein
MTQETYNAEIIGQTRPLRQLYGGAPASATLVGKREAHFCRVSYRGFAA